MKNRFIVKKVKIVWRNSMLAGNPISRSFTKFGVFDRNWESDHFCCCPRPGGEWPSNNGQSRKYRIVVDDEAKAKRIAEKMNELVGLVSRNKGTVPLTIYLTDPETRYTIEFLSKKFQVAVTAEFIEALERLDIHTKALQK